MMIIRKGGTDDEKETGTENLESFFSGFRKNIIGIDASFESPYGKQKILYTDWVASGRLYGPIEKKIADTFGPYVGNTHTESNETGTKMTLSYHLAQRMIKKHVNAGPDDVIITAGSGMTSVINKLQRILSLKGCDHEEDCDCASKKERPVVFITHMEHHSNHTSWLETNTDVVMIEPDSELLIDMENLKAQLELYKDRKFKIGSFTACSNVTGVITPYHQMARMMHEYGGICFVDFAASAPYVKMDMHPADPMEKLDAIFFSPHKFLGGPGSSGVLIFDSSLYNKKVPDNPGGGTVDWTNAWGEYKYVDDIEAREDGGTPGFLQTIKTALSIQLKNQFGVENIEAREEELVKIAFRELRKIPGVKILADNVEDRLAIISFYIEKLHYNLLVKLLNDRFGIQMRGGCACAGTYGHFLLDLSYERSKNFSNKIGLGDLSDKPGWVRMSLHPTTTDEELMFTMDAIRKIALNYEEWEKDYDYIPKKNEFQFKKKAVPAPEDMKEWFVL
ncbi:MAG: aminotransferase class V-fold PLP-dependent enzyme [Bacteroidales bacterium]|nr:aminotransferase class V-fold PLP-dependent enzyme [Bacteroidales bacterium]MCF8457600.1 aminotransferase class V-fold PLP-dependent enzyme [Bacteroidales bacterium]